jgi:transcriptional regulator PpsR
MPGVNLIEPDVTLRLDRFGVIRDAALAASITGEALESWIGRPWADTVVSSSEEQVRQVIEDVGTSDASILLQLKQRFPSGREVLMEYTTVRLGDGSGLLAIGKNLQAVIELQSRLLEVQREREQNSWKSRDLETRYRLLFDASLEALVLLDANSHRLLEANPAAARDLNLQPGDDFFEGIADKEHKRLQAMFRRVRDYGRSPRILVTLGANRTVWSVRASLLPAAPQQILMVQLAPLEEARAAPEHRVEETQAGYSIEGFIERFPDGFVIIDQHGVLERANRAFVDLVHVRNENAVIGERLSRWLPGLAGEVVDLLKALKERRTLKALSMKLSRENGEILDLMISGVSSDEGQNSKFGLMLRVVSRRIGDDETDWQLKQATKALTDRQGQVNLPQLVKESSEMLERRYIEAALKLANGNRTASAELLGISRQSLHLKLNRYAADGVGTPDRD